MTNEERLELRKIMENAWDAATRHDDPITNKDILANDFGDDSDSDDGSDTDDDSNIINTEEKKKVSTMQKGTFEMIKDASIRGLQVSAAAKANEAIMEGVKAAALKAGVPAEILEIPAVQLTIKAIMPILIHYTVTHHGKMIPAFIGADRVAFGAELALESSTREIVVPIMGMMMPMLKSIADAGKDYALALREEGSRGLASPDDFDDSDADVPNIGRNHAG